MHWIALLPEDGPGAEREAWGWHALRFTSRVAWVDEALLLEVSGSLRLWGGMKRLRAKLLDPATGLPTMRTAAMGRTSLAALALMRLRARGEPLPAASNLPAAFPIDTLQAALTHAGLLERMGCRTWGDLRALPRGGMARRFGAPLLEALDAAWGDRPERYAWIEAPESFDEKLELPATATSAPELMWSAQRLLSRLQAWLASRKLGVLALELEWTHDLKRLNGVMLPPTAQLVIRTARPAQDMAHLRRLLNERLSHVALAAPANHLRMRSLETASWGGMPVSLLPEDQVKGERLHEFVERVSARLGEDAVCVMRPGDDHRPERMQHWVAAKSPGAKPGVTNPAADALFPAWLLPQPQCLEVHNDTPHYGGPLRRLTRPSRMETAWWEEGQGGEEGAACFRDYYVAQGEQSGLVWIYRERRSGRWYLQGFYA
ncbi:Y-family DNA polymerase [Variovorax sp. VNK109]|uniref:Y-family DNA polymerase n=1 Tax=Variovorax sp. VNK109 TaxID=3400919 RepID=UPI003BFE6AF5